MHWYYPRTHGIDFELDADRFESSLGVHVNPFDDDIEFAKDARKSAAILDPAPDIFTTQT